MFFGRMRVGRLAVPPLRTSIPHPTSDTGIPRAAVFTRSREVAPEGSALTARFPVLRHGIAVLAIFAMSRILIGAIIWIAMTRLPMHVPPSLSTHGPNPIVEGLVRWDGFYYARIATQGYQPAATVFFPVYPLLVRAFTLLFSNVYVAGVVVSNLAFLVALSFVYALAHRECGVIAARCAILFLSLAPGSVFFSAMYAESVFVGLVAVTLYFARSQQWLWAGIVGAAAAATRNTGFILALVIALEGLQQAGALSLPRTCTRSSLAGYLRRQGRYVLAARPALGGAILAGSGLALYMAYLWYKFGDPVAFMHMEARWAKSVSLLNLLHPLPHGVLGIADAIDLGMALIFLVSIIGVARTMRPSFTVFAVLTFLLPLDTGGTTGMTRYTLMLVPCYLLLGRWGAHRLVRIAFLGLSLPIMMFAAITFSHWGNIQ